MRHETVPVARALVAFGGENVRVVVVRDTLGSLTAFVAQGLERDIAGQGKTIKAALDHLEAAAAMDYHLSTALGQKIDPAPPHVHEWYRQAPSEQVAAVAGEEQGFSGNPEKERISSPSSPVDEAGKQG